MTARISAIEIEGTPVMTTIVHEDWVKCPQGEFSRLAWRLRGKHRRRLLVRVSPVLPIAAIACAAWLLWPASHKMPDYNYAGITCSRVMQLAGEYAADTLSPDLRTQVREHVVRCPHCKQCPRCRPLLEEMGLTHRLRWRLAAPGDEVVVALLDLRDD
ncbi:MAG: zf-HC2 domain-containing protein [Planctomycetes bacterium]|nr:zf-HC2 domain-containing protein [Planctomycetota bacterium]